MAKIILGLASELAGGKGTVSKYVVSKYKGSSYKISTIIRDVLDRLHLEHNRENLQNLSTSLRRTFGENLLAKVMFEDIKNNNHKIIVIDGIRRMEDIEYLKSLPEFKLVYIDTALRIRYQRILGRKENPDDSANTLERFKKNNKNEADVKIRGLKSKAQFVVDNNGPTKNLYKQVDKIIGLLF